MGRRGISRGPSTRCASVAFLALGAVGCAAGGCGTTSGEPPAAARPNATDGNATSIAAPADLAPRPAALSNDGELPVLTTEALAARVDAQSRYLRNALFEDLEGRPVEARIEPDPDSPPPNDFEDDLLDALPGSSGIGSTRGESGAPRINGNALGLYAPVESPAKPALAHFHRALGELARGERRKVHVVVYGASHTQADVYPGYIRTYLQSRFGNGGVGFQALVRLNRWYRSTDYRIENDRKRWKIEHAQKRDRREDGLWGLLGASASATSKSATTQLIPRENAAESAMASQYEVQFVVQPGGGHFDLFVDGEKRSRVDTGGKAIAPGRHAFEVPLGHHELEIKPRGDGEVRLLGAILERDEPGVVVDTLGISGTRMTNQVKWDEDLWRSYYAAREPDLVTFAFGTNEATDTGQPIGDYAAKIREILARYQSAAPQASCLFIGPGDFPMHTDDDTWIPRPRVSQIIDAQRTIAYEFGCGFWDGRAFMGGVGSMDRWANARPQMGSRDHIHLTKRGYVRMGMGITDAIMAGYDGAHGG
jgi:lysophospholipase L1-like esterase